jgi:hypothetical protein
MENRVPTVGLEATSGEATNLQVEPTLRRPIGYLDFFLLRNVLLIVPPWEALPEI